MSPILFCLAWMNFSSGIHIIIDVCIDFYVQSGVHKSVLGYSSVHLTHYFLLTAILFEFKIGSVFEWSADDWSMCISLTSKVANPVWLRQLQFLGYSYPFFFFLLCWNLGKIRSWDWGEQCMCENTPKISLDNIDAHPHSFMWMSIRPVMNSTFNGYNVLKDLSLLENSNAIFLRRLAVF